MHALTDIVDWWLSLPAEWQFLFALPFAVVAAAFLGEWARGRGRHHGEKQA